MLPLHHLPVNRLPVNRLPVTSLPVTNTAIGDPLYFTGGASRVASPGNAAPAVANRRAEGWLDRSYRSAAPTNGLSLSWTSDLGALRPFILLHFRVSPSQRNLLPTTCIQRTGHADHEKIEAETMFGDGSSDGADHVGAPLLPRRAHLPALTEPVDGFAGQQRPAAQIL